MSLCEKCLSLSSNGEKCSRCRDQSFRSWDGGAVMSVLSQASPRPDVQVALLTRRGETCKLPLIELSNGCAF